MHQGEEGHARAQARQPGGQQRPRRDLPQQPHDQGACQHAEGGHGLDGADLRDGVEGQEHGRQENLERAEDDGEQAAEQDDGAHGGVPVQQGGGCAQLRHQGARIRRDRRGSGPPAHVERADERDDEGGGVDQQHSRHADAGHERAGEEGGQEELRGGGHLQHAGGPGVELGGNEFVDGGPQGRFGQRRQAGAHGDARQDEEQTRLGAGDGDEDRGQAQGRAAVAQQHHGAPIVPVRQDAGERAQQDDRREGAQFDHGDR